MSSKLTKQKGFTLIELVIVLAIAALIIVGVLLAVSGAQKSRRDSQRKNDVSRMLANAETYVSNHGGSNAGIAVSNVDSGMKDPSTGAAYDTIASGAGHVVLSTSTACDGSSLGANEESLTVTLESGDTACVDDK